MKNLISIKEARLKKGLSIAELANSLKLDVKLVQLLDDDAEIPDKYKLICLHIKDLYLTT